MRVLIRFITRTAGGGVETSDKIVDAPEITIGRATDRILHLRDRRVRLEHASIEQKNGATRIVANTLAGVTVNGRSERDVELRAGDTIEIGANILRVIDAPEGADFALTFELREDATGEFLEHSWTLPASGVFGLGKRRLSWALALVVLVVAFAVPALSLVSPSVASLLRGTSVLPDDGLWLAGPVGSAHSTTAAECENCHVNAFERVPDSACMACHDVARHAADDAHRVLGEMRCASCHLEHNEPPALVRTHQGLCADCHREPLAGLDLEPAGDFLDAHAAFRVSLLRPASDGGWTTDRLPQAVAGTAERSNLRFDHAAHLGADGITGPDGTEILDCGACHQPQPGGRLMQPIAMDEHCSRCHTLAFDPDEPLRAVPHGDPAGVVQTLVEFYSARLLGEDPDAVEQRVRRPGRTLTRAERDRAAAEARVKALDVAEDLFERRACATCHVVERSDGGTVPWQVVQVRLTGRFFPHADFSHAAHESGITSCADCHDAAASTSAEDLLMPAIGDCRECHGSAVARRNTASQIPSTCIMCHGFHADDKGSYP